MSRPHCRQIDDCKAKGSGHCRSCLALANSANPHTRARASESMKARLADPEFRERHLAGLRRCDSDPIVLAKRRESGRLHGAKNIELTRGPDSRRKAGRSISAAKLGWCPLDLKPLYVKLRNLYGAKKAREMVVEQMEIDARRASVRVRQSLERLAA